MEGNTQVVPALPAPVEHVTAQIAERAKMPMTLSATTIKAFFDGEDAQRTEAKIAGAEKSRLSYLLKLCEGADTATARKAAAEYVKDVITESGWKPHRGGPKPPMQVLVARVRASEVKAIYGAHRFCGWNPEGVGYHAAVNQARERLQTKGVNWQGMLSEKSEDQVRQEKAVKAERGKVRGVEQAIEVLTKERGRELTDEERVAIYQHAGLIYERETAYQIAFKLVRRYGPAQAEKIHACLPDAIREFAALSGLAAELKMDLAEMSQKEIGELREVRDAQKAQQSANVQ